MTAPVLPAQPQDSAALVQQVRALLDAPGLPPGAARSARSVLSRLDACITVAVIGPPDGPAGQLAADLAGLPAFPDGPRPPIRVVAASGEPGSAVTSRDGAVTLHRGWPDRALMAGALMVELSAPLQRLTDRALLLVEAGQADLPAAIGWACAQSDIAVYVAGAAETPDSANLAAFRTASARRALLCHAGSGPFEAVATAFDALIDRDAAPDWMDRVTAAIDRIVEEARAEDAAAALLLLRRFRPEPAPQRTAASPPVAPATKPVPDPLPHDCPRPSEQALRDQPLVRRASPPDDPARPGAAAMARVILRLGTTAAGLLDDVAAAPEAPSTAARVLDGCAAVLDRLAELADTAGGLSEHMPDFAAAIVEAQDTALLLRLEGGLDRAADACALLAQLRLEADLALAP